MKSTTAVSLTAFRLTAFRLSVAMLGATLVSACSNNPHEPVVRSDPLYTYFEHPDGKICQELVIDFLNEEDYVLNAKSIECSDELDFRETSLGHIKDIVLLDGTLEIGLLELSEDTELLDQKGVVLDADIPLSVERQPYYKVTGKFYHKELGRCFTLHREDIGAFVTDSDCKLGE